MTAAMLYRRASEAGITLRLVEGKVKASGSNKALAGLVPELRAHKAEIVALLSREAVNDPGSAEPSAPTISENSAKQTFMEHADTWRELDRAYQSHHFKCLTCKAAGLGYGLRCGTGAALWTTYSDAT